MSELPAVLLLHDQLMDARIWQGFIDLLSTHVRPVPVPAAPQTDFYAIPSEWARYLETPARNLLERDGPVSLTVATGWAVGAALSLVDDGLSDRALLINPGPTPAVPNDDWQVPDLDSIPPEVRDRITTLVPHPMPEPTGEWADEMRAGVIGPAAAAYFREISAGSLDELDEEHRRLAEQIQTENFGRLLPVALDQLRSADPQQDSDWVLLAARLSARCAVALSGSTGLWEPLRASLQREAPDLPIVDLGLRGSLPWLEDPARVDRLIRELLTREP